MTGVKTFVCIAPHPIELLVLIKKYELERAKLEMLKGIDSAADFIREGEAVGFGEIGWPHFKVADEIQGASMEIFKYTLSLAKELDCAAVLHTDTFSPERFRFLAEICDRIGISKDRVVKHYSPPITKLSENFGIFPSIIATRKNIKKAIRENNRFLLETDYLDDAARPDAVMPPETVPKKTKTLYNINLLSADDWYAIHKENPEKIYKIEVKL